MLFDLEPDRSVTGGAWYSDQDFDAEFVYVLNQTCFKFLQEKVCLLLLWFIIPFPLSHCILNFLNHKAQQLNIIGRERIFSIILWQLLLCIQYSTLFPVILLETSLLPLYDVSVVAGSSMNFFLLHVEPNHNWFFSCHRSVPYQPKTTHAIVQCVALLKGILPLPTRFVQRYSSKMLAAQTDYQLVILLSSWQIYWKSTVKCKTFNR